MLKIKIALFGLMMAFASAQAADGNLQIVNLSPDSSMNLVEVSLDGTVLKDSLEFNEATAYLTVPEGTGLTLQFKSVKYPTEIFELTNVDVTAAGFFQSILFGVINTADYAPNPDGQSLDLDATFTSVDTSGVDASELRVNFFHATSDAVELDVADSDFEYIVDDMLYGTYSSTSTDLPNDSRNIFFTSTDSVVTVTSRTVDLSTIAGKTVTIFLSGFIVAADNSDGPEFGVFAVDEAGNVINLDLVNDVFNQELVSDLQLAPNPAGSYTTLRFNNINLNNFNVSLVDLTGRRLSATNYQAQAGYNQIRVELPEVVMGMYFLLLETENSSQVLPLVIAR